MIKKLKTAIFLLILSCNFAPKYQTPKAEISLEEGQKQIDWKDYFQSQEVQNLIQTALQNNQDLKIATLNIENAFQAQNIALSALFPQVNATSSITRQVVPTSFASFNPSTQYRAGISFTSYEADFFGKLYNTKESARQSFLATQEAKNITQLALISNVVTALAKALLEAENLQIAEEAISSYKIKLQIIQQKNNNGRAQQSEVLTAQNELNNLLIVRENFKQSFKVAQTTLMILLGINEEPQLPNMKLSDIKINHSLLNLLPSKNLLLRPEIKQVEHLLQLANADIGVARANFFPSITLTSNVGFTNSELNQLWNSQVWSFIPQISLPIFNGGRNLANLKIRKTQKQIYIETYKKTIQNAFKESLDSLEARKTLVNKIKISKNTLENAEKNLKIYEKRNFYGSSDYLSVQNAKITQFNALQALNNQKYEEIANLALLYKVLGVAYIP